MGWFLISLLVLLMIPLCNCASAGSGSHAAPKLEDTTWMLVDVQGAPAHRSPDDARAPSFRLSPDMRVSGYSGVNQFSGGYERQGQMLKFGNLAMTRRAASPELMQQESEFTGALARTAAWRAQGEDRIELLDADGKRLALFAAEDTK